MRRKSIEEVNDVLRLEAGAHPSTRREIPIYRPNYQGGKSGLRFSELSQEDYYDE